MLAGPLLESAHSELPLAHLSSDLWHVVRVKNIGLEEARAAMPSSENSFRSTNRNLLPFAARCPP